MADKKIIDLPALVTQLTTDLYETSADGAGSYKETRAQMLAYMQANIVSSDNIVYVRNSGSDVTGNGSILNPYATVQYANLQITTASLSNPFMLDALGSFSDSDFTYKPNILYQFNNSSYSVTNTVVLDAAWSSGGVSYIYNLFASSFAGGINLDFDAVGAPFAVTEFFNINTNDTSLVNIVGSSTGATIVVIQGMQGFSNQESLQLQNCYGAILGGAPSNVTIIHDSETSGGNFRLENIEILGEFIFQDNTAAGMTLLVQNSSIIGSTLYQALGTGTLNVISTATRYLFPCSLQCTSPGFVYFDVDFIDQLPLLIGDATFSPTSIANGMLANLTPVVYTPVDSSVTGNLMGIDNFLGSLSPSPPPVTLSSDLSIDSSTAGKTYISDDASFYTISLNVGASISPGVSTTFYSVVFNALVFYLGAGCTINGNELGSSFYVIIPPGNEFLITCIGVDTYEYTTTLPPTLQQILDYDSTGTAFVIYPQGLTFRNYSNSYPVLNIGQYAKFFGYNYQQSLTADITLNSTNVGSVLVSDNVANHNVTLINYGVSNDYDLQVQFITGITYPITLLVPSGTTLNGVDGSVTPSVQIPAGLTYAQLIRTSATSYVLNYNPVFSTASYASFSLEMPTTVSFPFANYYAVVFPGVSAPQSSGLTINSDGRVVCVTPGRYSFVYVVTATSTSALNLYNFVLAKNSIVNLQSTVAPTLSSTSQTVVTVQMQFDLVPGDIIQLYVYNSGVLVQTLNVLNVVCNITQI